MNSGALNLNFAVTERIHLKIGKLLLTLQLALESPSTNRKLMLGHIYHEMKKLICNHCKKQEIGDNFHYIQNCTSLQQEQLLGSRVFV